MRSYECFVLKGVARSNRVIGENRLYFLLVPFGVRNSGTEASLLSLSGTACNSSWVNFQVLSPPPLSSCISFLALIQYEISNSLWHSVLTRLSGLAAGLAHFQLDRACSATHHNASVALTWGFMASPGEGWVALNGSDTITCWARHGLGLTSWARVAYTTTADSYPWIRYTEA